jgi:hypothetical protein
MRGSGRYLVGWPQCSPGRGIRAFLAVLGALAWSLGFAIWAYVGAAGTECILMPAGETTCRSTPLAHGFGRELLAVLVPAMVCLVVWVLLRRYCTRGGWLARGVAAALAALFVAFCWLAALSVGRCSSRLQCFSWSPSRRPSRRRLPARARCTEYIEPASARRPAARSGNPHYVFSYGA